MRLHPIDIGGIMTPNNVFMAPLAGYTNYPFRKICLHAGAGLAFTEMVSAKGLHYGNENTKELLITGDDEKIKAVQLFGNDPTVMREVCESEELAPFSVVDINMGCPMPKIYNNGEGSALLADRVLAAELVRECKKSGKRVTVKMRIGITKDQMAGPSFAKALEQAGADMLTVHGRTKEQVYSGDADADAIAEIKRAVRIPVIANGGIFGTADADVLLERSGADGVMLARAAMSDPQIFCDFTGMPRVKKLDMILTELTETEELYGDRFATVFVRKMAGFYMKGERGAAQARIRFLSCGSPEEIREAAEELLGYE